MTVKKIFLYANKILLCIFLYKKLALFIYYDVATYPGILQCRETKPGNFEQNIFDLINLVFCVDVIKK